MLLERKRSQKGGGLRIESDVTATEMPAFGH
jgi:hypothetical protein